MDYFRENPKPFFTLSKELYPGNFEPTTVHHFLKLLHDKELLLRVFTQNVDTLERIAGVPGEKLIEAHGSFAAAHCIECKAKYTQEFVKKAVMSDTIPHCTEKDCDGLVKPDIIFFGESLPPRFFECVKSDFPKCDFLIVIGTSLQVQPFASLVDRVSESCPRLLLNMEDVGSGPMMSLMKLLGMGSSGFDYSSGRDAKHLGDCQAAIREFCSMMDWADDLKVLEAAAKKPQESKKKAEL
eukprot:TRINITY_DN20264_c0_g1_i1.p1 TRINITY_DN20264_c0_g1~~TRINITY_DN20264_c0_g1_i1.p1  ORF type:complete len:240 (-),score=46.92 TRINITY_DN20264_c0_g1_i1:6-725(-)